MYKPSPILKSHDSSINLSRPKSINLGTPLCRRTRLASPSLNSSQSPSPTGFLLSVLLFHLRDFNLEEASPEESATLSHVSKFGAPLPLTRGQPTTPNILES